MPVKVDMIEKASNIFTVADILVYYENNASKNTFDRALIIRKGFLEWLLATKNEYSTAETATARRRRSFSMHTHYQAEDIVLLIANLVGGVLLMGNTSKIKGIHLNRKAILYIRQSTMRQVLVNTESTVRQYGLKTHLNQLGWDDGMIEVIDCDLGRSGAEIASREGFRQMLTDVAEGNVGAIASIECSRLSRSSGDWGRLTEICALSETILIDDDGIYNPNDFNDRLLLGLKGTMSEAELHYLRERMRGGALSKANRGDLRYILPVGYLYDEEGKTIKDPDMQVQDAINQFFESFRICGTAHRLAKYYAEKGYLIPTDKNRGIGGKSDIYWSALTPSRAHKMLHTPAYAGIYVYGKSQVKNSVNGRKRIPISEEQWISNIEGHHDTYITVDNYRANCATLKSNQTRDGASPPREGKALIQGIAICAQCGGKMSVNYKMINGNDYWQYICGRALKNDPYVHDHRLCVNGRFVDEAVSNIILKRLTPEAIKSAGEVLRELEKRKLNEDGYFAMQVEKSKYEVALAKKRYMNADPENRLVSSELERLWNERMSQLAKAESELSKSRGRTDLMYTKADIEQLLYLPERLRKAWSNDTLCIIDKKRIVRCLIEDIALSVMGNEICIGIRFKGGATEFLTIPRPLKKYETWQTDPEIVDFIREASKHSTVEEIVEKLNSTGKKSGQGLSFNVQKVRNIQWNYNIPSYKQYLRSIGYLSTDEKAVQMGINPNTLNKRRATGKYSGECIKTTASGDYMFGP